MKAFDNEKYLRIQSESIIKRIDDFDNKLYLELGGKLFDDFHAARVLPGFLKDSKIRMLQELKDDAEVLITINALDIEKNKARNDLGITYDSEVLRLIDAFKEVDLNVAGVIITQYQNQTSTNMFRTKLTNFGVKVFLHYPIEGYPTNINLILSEEGFGRNDFVETTKPLVFVTAPGPGSGKMAVSLSQLYHEQKRGIKAGYAKFETFPVWNIALNHPVNLAYEAATADLNDLNMIDYLYLEKHNQIAVTYNRDLETFPILKTMFERIYGVCPYNSPTEMGVNMIKDGFNDESAIIEASKQEVIRRYFHALCDLRNGKIQPNVVEKIVVIMKQLGISADDRKCVQAALKKEESSKTPAMAMQLTDGTIIRAKSSTLLGAPAALLINALKYYAKIDKKFMLISPNVIDPIQKLKVEQLGNNNPRLHADEILIALAIAATNNPIADLALQQLHLLEGAQVHSTIILAYNDENTYRKLKIDVTTEPIIYAKNIIATKKGT